MKAEPIVLERSFNANSDVIWKALTDKEEMKKWYFDIAAFEPTPGFEFEFTAKGDDGVTEFVHLCKIVEVIEGKKLSYTWRYKGYEGNSLLTFELFPEGNNTRLKLTHEGLETLPFKEYPAFAKQNFIEGWTYFMSKALPEYVSKQGATV